MQQQRNDSFTAKFDSADSELSLKFTSFNRTSSTGRPSVTVCNSARTGKSPMPLPLTALPARAWLCKAQVTFR